MQGRRGFTLTEVAVSLGLSAIAAGIVAPRLATLAASLRLGSTARVMAQTMRLVRGQALAEGGTFEVRFDAPSRTWWVRAADGTSRLTTALPAPLAFDSLPASARIRFGPSGTSDNGTIVLGADGRQTRIVVNQRGRVRVQ